MEYRRLPPVLERLCPNRLEKYKRDLLEFGKEASEKLTDRNVISTNLVTSFSHQLADSKSILQGQHFDPPAELPEALLLENTEKSIWTDKWVASFITRKTNLHHIETKNIIFPDSLSGVDSIAIRFVSYPESQPVESVLTITYCIDEERISAHDRMAFQRFWHHNQSIPCNPDLHFKDNIQWLEELVKLTRTDSTLRDFFYQVIHYDKERKIEMKKNKSCYSIRITSNDLLPPGMRPVLMG